MCQRRLVLPFALFPLNPEQKTGLLFPKDFESSEILGFGLKDIGYYFHINDRMDLSVMGELYTRGTWGLSVSSNYKKRYKFSGSLYTSFRNEKTENTTTAEIVSKKRFAIRWSHRQDQNSNPYHNFQASVNIDFNKYESQVHNDADRVLKSTYSSNLSYNRKFPGKPYSFSASASHSQNTNSGQVSVTLPDMRFNVRRIKPFDLKSTKGDSEKWFEKVGFQYDANFKNSMRATDSTLFKQETLDMASFGLKHNASLTSPFSVLKHININPNLRYEESWHFKTEEKEFDATMIMDTVMLTDTTNRIDTTFGTVNTLYNYGLKPVRKMSASVSLGTSLEKIFNLPFKKVPAFRHKMTPSVSYSYSPNWVPEGTSQKLYMTDLRPEENDTLEYSIYASNFLLNPNPNINTSQVIGFSLGNNFEAKYMPRKDSTLKKMVLLSSLSISSSYNVVTDSFSSVRFAPSSIKLLKGLTNVAMNMTMSPYTKNADGKVIKEFYWKDAKRPLRFEHASMTVTTGISVQKIRNIFSNEDKPKPTPNPNRNADAHILDLFNKLNLTHILRVERNKRNNNDTLILQTNNIRLQGSIPLSKAWTLGIGSIGYEFTKKSITYPSFSLKRDLHCWQMSFSWAPQRNSYAFNISVKPGTLQFIKLPYKRNNIDRNLTL